MSNPVRVMERREQVNANREVLGALVDASEDYLLMTLRQQLERAKEEHIKITKANYERKTD